MRTLCAVLVVVLGLAGCARGNSESGTPKVSLEPKAAGAGGDAASSKSSTGNSKSGTSSGGAAGDGDASKGTGPASTSDPKIAPGDDNSCFKPVTTSRNTVELTVTVSPTRVAKGGSVRVEVKTEPDMLTAVSFEFIDHKPHGAYSPPSRTRPDGSWDWVGVIGPDAPSGPARVMVASGAGGGKGAAGEARFTVLGSWEKTCDP